MTGQHRCTYLDFDYPRARENGAVIAEPKDFKLLNFKYDPGNVDLKIEILWQRSVDLCKQLINGSNGSKKRKFNRYILEEQERLLMTIGPRFSTPLSCVDAPFQTGVASSSDVDLQVQPLRSVSILFFPTAAVDAYSLATQTDPLSPVAAFHSSAWERFASSSEHACKSWTPTTSLPWTRKSETLPALRQRVA